MRSPNYIQGLLLTTVSGLELRHHQYVFLLENIVFLSFVSALWQQIYGDSFNLQIKERFLLLFFLHPEIIGLAVAVLVDGFLRQVHQDVLAGEEGRKRRDGEAQSRQVFYLEQPQFHTGMVAFLELGHGQIAVSPSFLQPDEGIVVQIPRGGIDGELGLLSGGLPGVVAVEVPPHFPSHVDALDVPSLLEFRLAGHRVHGKDGVAHEDEHRGGLWLHLRLYLHEQGEKKEESCCFHVMILFDSDAKVEI